MSVFPSEPIRRFLLFIALATSAALGQAVGRSWTQPPASTIIRDPQALQMVEKVLSATRLGEAQAIADFSMTGQVTFWAGETVSGNFTQKGIGTENRSTIIDTINKTGYLFTSIDDLGTFQKADGQSINLSREQTMESDCYFLTPLLQEALNNTLVEVQYVAGPIEASDGHIRITRHAARWNTSLRELGSAQFDIFVNPSTSTVSQVTNRIHFAATMSHSVEHSLIFSDYRAEQGWLVPHAIEERYVGRVTNRLVLTSFVFNQNLDKTTLTAR